MPDHYAVVGNPIAHSLSPTIQRLFAEQTHQDMDYQALLIEEGKFVAYIEQLKRQAYRGVNITLPFKGLAYQLADICSTQAHLAKAVNTLIFKEDGSIYGDNTDGLGLLRDLTQALKQSVQNKHILIIGAGGAARGVIPVLLAEKAKIHIINRTPEKAEQLATEFSPLGYIQAQAWQEHTQPYDIIIHATSLTDAQTLPICQLNPQGGCYDLSYGARATAFLNWSQRLKPAWVADGLGMLIEQAAEAFFLWRDVMPDTQAVRMALAAKTKNTP